MANGHYSLYRRADVKQFKLNGNAELHNVNIMLYGTRFLAIRSDLWRKFCL